MSLFSLFTLALITVAAFGLGRPLVRALRVVEGDRLAVGVWSVALGLILAGTGLAVLGLAGVLYGHLIAALTLLAGFLGVAQLLRAMRAAPAELSTDAGASETSALGIAPPPRWMAIGLLFLVLLAAATSLLGALAPTTAGDALCYHLELPKTFLAEHAVTFTPYDDQCTYPLLAEMWYLWALAIDGGIAAQLIHWEMGLLLALATVLLATPIVGRPWAWVSAAVVLLTPGVNNQMTAPLNDVALAALCTLALAAWWQPVMNDESRRWYLLAGLAAGGAIGAKYVALLLPAALLPVFAWQVLRKAGQRRGLLEGAAVVALVAVSVGGLWYVRAAWHRGNPVYPFFGRTFASDSAADDEANVRATVSPEKARLGRTPWAWLTSPWQATMHPELCGGRGHQLGIVFLAALPGLWLCRRLRGMGTLLAVALGYWTAWFLLRQNVRFLLPIVPVLAIGVAWAWSELRHMPLRARQAACVLLGGLVVGTALIPVVRCRQEFRVALGLDRHKDYLRRHEPTYSAAEMANSVLGRTARVLSQEQRAFYFDCHMTLERTYRRATSYPARLTTPADLSRYLRQEGFSHVLLAETVSGSGITYDPTLSTLVEAQRRADPAALVKLADYRFADSDGAVRRYQLLGLR